VTLLSQFREDDVEVRDERIENGGEICPVQEVGDATEQVPQQIAGSWDGRNMEHDLIQVDDKAKYVQMQALVIVPFNTP
jgi:hypothetical protein